MEMKVLRIPYYESNGALGYGVLQRIGYYPKGYSNSNNLIAVELETK